ncbi:MAG: hypothetical protein IH971_03855 [Candidatus Marinimicrobia bacterium]|nr:hypothetical protein [Candidatus Neomarinimicrobiota bacterium]
MSRISLLRIGAVISLALLWSMGPRLRAQEIDHVTLEKKRLLILPARGDAYDPFGINREATSTIASLAVRLGRFTIMDRNTLESIILEQDLVLLGLLDDAHAVELGKITSAREALLVTVLNFSQKAVPPEDKAADDKDDRQAHDSVSPAVRVLAWIFRRSSDKPPRTDEQKVQDPEVKYAHNIQTQLTVEVRSLDVETGESLYSFVVDASHTGGAKGKSRAAAMAQFRQRARFELRALYLLSTQVISAEGNEVVLLLGTSVGVRPGMLFTIKEPDREQLLGERSITIPGREVAYARVSELSDDVNRSVFLRQWRPVEPGYQAVENLGVFGIAQLEFLSGPGFLPMSLGFRALIGGLRNADVGVGVRYIRARDTYDHIDQGFNIGAMVGLRAKLTPRFSLVGRMAFDFDVAFRRDDAGHSVSTPLLSASPALYTETLLTRSVDIVVGAGYRLGGRSDEWTYSEDDPDSDESLSLDAVWDGDPPEVDISGPFLTVGLYPTNI